MAQASTAADGTLTLKWILPSSHPPETSNQELEAFHFFKNFLVRSLSGLYDSSLWTQHVLPVSMAEPVVRHALVALGALGRRDQSGTTAKQDRLFALQEYSKAMKSLHAKIAEPDRMSSDLILTTCILFVVFELWQGGRKQAKSHLQGGLKIIRELQEDASTPSTSSSVVLDPLVDAFELLDIQVSLNTNDRVHLNRTVDLARSKRLPEDTHFESVSDASRPLNVLMAAMREIVHAVELRAFTPEGICSDDYRKFACDQARQLVALSRWEQAMASLFSGLKGPREQQAARQLQLHHLCTKLMVSMCLCDGQEMLWDSFTADFQRLLDLANTFTDVVTTSKDPDFSTFPIFSVNMGVLAPLYFVTLKCRDPAIRHKALQLLSSCNHQEGAWDGQILARSAAAVIELEEQCLSVVKASDVPEMNRLYQAFFDQTLGGNIVYSLQKGTEGVKQVTENSVYRIGSGSKLITIYLILIEVGWKYWDHPITDFVPQLGAAARKCSAGTDAVDCIDWNGVTLGALASHMAGIPRDYATTAELLASGLPVVEYGLPPLPGSDYPPCGTNYTNACPEDEYLYGLTAAHPVFEPFTSVVYSNAGFELLAFALENITGRSFESMLQADLFDKVNMTHSSYNVPTDFSDAVLPGGAYASGFDAILGNETPVGGYYSSPADLVRMGQSILSATLLSPNTIRKWMKPVTFTSSMTSAVGMPWEIFRLPNLIDHVFDLYTKEGDVFSYSSMFAIAPDYGVGFVVLAAGNETTSTVEYLSDTIAATIFPGLEDAARAQSQQRFGGTYQSTIAGLASNITLSTKAGQPGLVVTDWYSNGTDFLLTVAGIRKATAGVDVRLYPSGLVQQTSATSQRVGFRAVFASLETAPDGGVFSSHCTTWEVADQLMYGNVGLDEFVFAVNDGKAVSVTPRALRTTLEKNA
ncbi:hypothetical protein LTR85_006216 [Meristemomyces frigidus]|nr:hypothetical protein LTR85_006216 [Meristemomyces frigidus]